MYSRLISFDFDNTLFNTPDSFTGKEIWKEKTGTDWPYGGWWSKPESLDTNIFYIPLNMWVYKRYLEAVADPENYVILATGRLLNKAGMPEAVNNILRINNLSFDEVQLNWGGDTYRFKTHLYENLIRKLKVNELVMYDDRHEHIVKFRAWALEQDVKISIIDVINKKKTIFENNLKRKSI